MAQERAQAWFAGVQCSNCKRSFNLYASDGFFSLQMWQESIPPLSSVMRFILAMVLYPEVQRKAQEEIERVVGTDRLPTVDE